MAFFMLHNILFPVTKLVNQHLLLDEFYHIQWTQANRGNYSSNSFADYDKISKQTKPQEQQAELLSTHTVLFGMSLVNFVLSHKCLNSIHLRRDQRSYLFNLLLILLVCLSGYLYTANTIDNLGLKKMSPLHCINAAMLLVFLAVAQWSQFVIGSICNTLSVRASIQEDRKSASSIELNQFVAQLMFGSFGVAFMSLGLLEIFISNTSFIESQIGYTNVVLIVAILSMVLELACFKLLTVARHVRRSRDQGEKRITTQITLDDDDGADSIVASKDDLVGNTKMIYALTSDRKDLPPIVWSISAKNVRKNSETTHSTDDDEFDNSALSYQSCLGFQLSSDLKSREANRQQVDWLDVGGDVELFDRTKYSLYEESDRHVDDERDPPGESGNQIKTIGFASQKRQQGNSPTDHPHFTSVLEVLLIGGWPFVWQIVALILIGTVYQANQLCYFSEYISYLLYKSPWQFRWTILTGAGPILQTHSHQSPNANVSAIWICVVCISVTAQNTTRILGLQYANYLLIRLGTKGLFWILIVISVSIPLHFAFNYHLIESSYNSISQETKVIIVFSHIFSIQLLTGFVGALVDFTISELALQHCQYVRTYRTTRVSPYRSDGSIQCTIHGLLDGSFLYLGTATMSAIRILADEANRRSIRENDADPLVIVIFASVPLVIMISLVVSLGFHKWNIGRAAGPN